MKAMILAAGLGTRLRPLTDTHPKALVELSGRTLLEITLTRLRTFSITEVIINVHHFADMVIDYLKSNNNFGMSIEVSREEVLLDTGGGLKKAAWFFLEHTARRNSSQTDEPFLLHNVDVISNIDLRRMLQFHTENRALATLAVQTRETSRYLLFNDHHQLCGRRIADKDTLIPIPHHAVIPPPQDSVISSEARNLSSSPPRDARAMNPTSAPLQGLAFSGIHAISPRLLPMLTEEGVFSIIPSYLRLAAQGEKILAFRADNYYWRDLGRPADLAQAAHDLQQNVFL
jgi:NDP-sugar pyrophosphorylase family protein